MSDRETLWNAVEAAEKLRNAQVAREVEFALPEELSQARGDRAGAGVRAARIRGARDGGRPERPLG